MLHETRESEPDANATRVRILLLFHKIFRIDDEGARLILESDKKVKNLFIAPKARQILHETSQRALARCECAQHTGFLIKLILVMPKTFL